MKSDVIEDPGTGLMCIPRPSRTGVVVTVLFVMMLLRMRRSVTVPVPLAVAAAALVVVLGGALVYSLARPVSDPTEILSVYTQAY